MPINGELTFPDVPGKINEHNQSPNAHSVRIDNTVSQSGMAADAKATRDLVENVSGQIEEEIDALDGQVTDLKSAIKDLPILIRNISVSSGASHSSAKDTIKTNIKSGDKYYIRVIQSGGRDFRIKTYFADGTGANGGWKSTSDYFAELTASGDIVELGLEVPADSGESYFNFYVAQKPIGYDVVNTLYSTVPEITTKVEKLEVDSLESPYLSTNIPVSANTGHSDTRDRLNVSIETGEQYRLIVKHVSNRKYRICTFYSDGTDTKTGYTANNYDRTITATKDVIQFGIEVPSDESADEFSVIVVNDLFINGVLNVVDSLTSVSKYNPFIVMQYSVSANSSHGSTADLIPVDIKQNTDFKIRIVQTTVKSYRIYYWYSDGTSTNTAFYSDLDRTLNVTASKDITHISLGVPSDATASNYTLTILQDVYGIELHNLLKTDVPQISDDITRLNNSLSHSLSNTVSFEYTTGSAHSSAADALHTNIKQGESFVVTIDASSSIECFLYAEKTDGTTAQLFTQFNTITSFSKFFTADFDIVALRLYIDPPASNGKCVITVGQGVGSEILKNNITTKGYMLDSSLKKHSIFTQRKVTLKYGQAFCIYDNKFYSTDGSNICEQTASGEILRDVAINVGHGNTMQLSMANDGIVYVSGLTDSTIYVVDLSTITVTDTITLPYSGYTNSVVDDVANVAYVFHRSTTSDIYYTLYKYDIANSQTLEQKPFYNGRSMQGLDLYNDTILMSHGMGTDDDPSGYKAFNINGIMLGEYVVNDIIDIEPQGICIDRNTRNIHVMAANKIVYEIY